jgi:hypothetical protein
VKIGVEAALAGVRYNFGKLTMTKAHVMALESFAHYFPKGFTRPPSVESIPDLGKMRWLYSRISLLLVSIYLRTRFFWIFHTNFRCSCMN